MLQDPSWTESAHPCFGMETDEADGFSKGRANCQSKSGIERAVAVLVVLDLFVVCSKTTIFVTAALVRWG
jgi:hypothetical protein